MSVDEQTVFVKQNRYGSAASIYHTDADCRHLENASSVREVSLDALFDDVRECRRCADKAESSGIGRGHLQSLKAAASGDDEEVSS